MAEGEALAGRPPQMRWWGWGDGHADHPLDRQALAFLRERIGVSPQPRPPVELSAVRLDPPALGERARRALEEILPAGGMDSEHEQRVRHAAGRGYVDLVRLRAGEPNAAPDAILYPEAYEQIEAVLEVCQRQSVAVVPFGGGTSVVGGVEPLRGEHEAVVSLEMSRIGSKARIDRESLLARVGAGVRVAAFERHLASHGLTLGHFPQSFEHVSLGGCAATRSAGQASTGYGSFADMVEGVRVLTPAGPLALPAFPATAAGPDLRQLVVGSEGVLGVISELELRLRRAPEFELYEGVFFEDFAGGSEALRELAQERVAPALVRLSDRSETEIAMRTGGSSSGVKQRLGRYYLGVRGYSEGCLSILGFNGSRRSVERQRRRARRLVRRFGGLPVGRSVGDAWASQRFSAPYLRDELLTHGVMVETLETATHWSNLARLYREVGEAIRRELDAMGTPGIVMCHISHTYETGASLYFTFLARQLQGEEIGQWRTVKRAASEAIVAGGGTITHHHAVGSDHRPWIEREIGESGLEALRALKATFDPAGIMNPGKLLA